MRFGERLREILEAKGLSQADLSRMSEIEEGHISKIINGRLTPSQRTVDKIADALDMPRATFYDDDIAIKQLVEEIMREMPPDLIDFIKAQKNQPWLAVMKDLSVMNIAPEQVVQIIRLWKETVERSIK